MISGESCVNWLKSLDNPNGLLKNIQKKGRESLLKISYPNSNEEVWRLTNFKHLKKFIELPLTSETEDQLIEKYPSLTQPNPEIIQLINGKENSLKKLENHKGFYMLRESEREKYLGKALDQFNCNNYWPIIINESTSNHFIGIEVSGKNNPTLEIISPGFSNSSSSIRILLKITKNSYLNFNHVILGSTNSAQNILVEIILEEGAVINHGYIALGCVKSNLLTNFAIDQAENSSYSSISLQANWEFSRFEPRIIQKHGKAKTTLKGLQVSKDSEQISTLTSVKFNGPEGELDQLNKSAANDSSHAMFNGAVSVPRIAQKTQASQLSRNLILSKRAKIDTKPELEIVADDVRCTHGATVSQLLEDELFYLRSRGISLKEANSLLLEGYFKDILTNIPSYSKRWTFLNNLLSKLAE